MNELIYPEVRRLLPDLEDDILESHEENHVADVLLGEFAALSSDAERFDAKATVLIERVAGHVDEEEQDWFPQVRAGLVGKQLRARRANAEDEAEGAGQPSSLKETVDAVLS